ncbi:DNA excision repair protein, partial [Hortaea werneckii]
MLQLLFKTTTSYNVSYLDGSMTYQDRQNSVDEFNASDDQFVFLISTKAGGIGLNITSANKVVVVDPNWNPSYDLQAQDRAYRIGQTRDVEVFRLVSKGTVEEIVYARQIYKQQQANIGYNASVERRYFRGVQDQKEMKGEIFGLKNLFAAMSENVVLREIVNKTNVAETRAGVEIAGLDLESSSQPRNGDDDDDDDEDGRGGGAGSMWEDVKEDDAMSQLAADIIDAPASRRKKANEKAKKRDPAAAILASVGVEYTHENAEVIGTSKIETRISSRAQKAGNDLDFDQDKAFG